MKLSNHISSLRTLVNSFSDDSKYTDQFLAEQLVLARNIIYEQKVDKFHAISRQSYRTICIPLQEETYHDCNCVPENLGCKVLKSKFKIPNILQARNMPVCKVTTIDGNELGYMQIFQRRRNRFHKAIKITYDLVNRDLTIFGTKDLKVVVIDALFSNPFDLIDVPNCDLNGNILGVCYDVLNDEFPMEDQYAYTVYEIVIGKLFDEMKTKDDNTSNDRTDS